MPSLRVGVVGCGVMGVRHLEAVRRNAHAVAHAVADTQEARAERAASEHGVKRIYTDGMQLVRDPEVDAVIMATPAAFRDELAIEALMAGKHVLLEKPAAMNADTVVRMIEHRGDRVVACCSCRFHAYPSARVAADFVSTGVLGDLRMIHCRVHEAATGTPKTSAPEWRLRRAMNGGGILVNWGSYDLDYLMGITGWSLVPREVLAATWPVPPRQRPNVAPGSDAEAHVAFLARCDNGAVISYERGEYMPAAGRRCWQIVGTHGSLNLTMLYAEDKVISHDDTTTEHGVTTREIWRGNDRWEDMQGFEVGDFIEAIVSKREPQTSLEKALVLQRITDAVYRSAETGTSVEIR